MTFSLPAVWSLVVLLSLVSFGGAGAITTTTLRAPDSNALGQVTSDVKGGGWASLFAPWLPQTHVRFRASCMRKQLVGLRAELCPW